MGRGDFALKINKSGNRLKVIAHEGSLSGPVAGRLTGRFIDRHTKLLVETLAVQSKYQPGLEVYLVRHCEINASLWQVSAIQVQADERQKFIFSANGYYVVRNSDPKYPYKLEKAIRP